MNKCVNKRITIDYQVLIIENLVTYLFYIPNG